MNQRQFSKRSTPSRTQSLDPSFRIIAAMAGTVRFASKRRRHLVAAGRTKQLHSPPFVGVSQLLLTHYYDHKLRQKSDDVRDHELQTLFDYCEGNPHAQALRDLVVRLQSQRLIPVAKALLENREQFSNDVADVKKQVS